MNHLQLLKKLHACTDATEFAATQPDMETAWANCQRPDWMLWLMRETGYKDDRSYRLFACRCIRETKLQDGRTVWDLLEDPCSRNAVEVAEKYAVGGATAEDLVEARKDAAYAAYAVAYAVAYADAVAYAAAYASAYAAADASAYAAYADAYDAYADAYAAADASAYASASAYAAYAAARKMAHSQQANILREMFPWETISQHLAAFKP